MKKILVLILLLTYGVTALAQPPVPFPTENAAWCYDMYGDQGAPLGQYCIQTEGFFAINGKTYTKATYITLPGSSEVQGYYREENRKLYLLSEDFTNEYKLYDFNLILGDSFLVNWGFGVGQPVFYTVTNQDSITTSDGKVRKKLTLNSTSGGGFNEWIEGIGDSDWPFLNPNYVISVSGGFTFQCFSVNGQVVYPVGGGITNCGLIGIQNPLDSPQIAIVPNPFDEQLTISSEEVFIRKVEILDAQGRIVYLKNHLNTQYFQASDANGLETGLFFIRVFSSDQKVFVQKLMGI